MLFNNFFGRRGRCCRELLAKGLESQGYKGYSVGIWSWNPLLEEAESPNTGDFPKVVEQARWGGKCSLETSPAGQLCSILGLFCVVFQAWRCGCVASQVSPEDKLSGMALLQDSRAPSGKEWEGEAWAGRECSTRVGEAAVSRSHLRSGSFPGFPNCQPCNCRNKPTC